MLSQAERRRAGRAGKNLADPARSMTLKEKDPIDPKARHPHNFINFSQISLDLVSFILVLSRKLHLLEISVFVYVFE